MILISFSIEKIIIPYSYCALSVPPNLLQPTKSNLYLANSLVAAVNEPAVYTLLTHGKKGLRRVLGSIREDISGSHR